MNNTLKEQMAFLIKHTGYKVKRLYKNGRWHLICVSDCGHIIGHPSLISENNWCTWCGVWKHISSYKLKTVRFVRESNNFWNLKRWLNVGSWEEKDVAPVVQEKSRSSSVN